MPFDASTLRKDYLRGELDESAVHPDPFVQFDTWLNAAIAANLIEANAMTVATVDAEGQPAARTVLLKSFGSSGFVFATSYDSDKGRQIAATHRASLLFYWPALERQVRISGSIDKVSPEESDAIFNARPREARISALASQQSQVIPNREYLVQRVAEVAASLPEGEAPSRPDTWGGYRVVPTSIEFWQGRKNRLHDRIRYRRDGESWIIERLAP